MEEKIPLAPKKEKYPEDLKDVFKNLLYLTPKIALPVSGNSVTAVQKAFQEAGSYENLKLWAFPNPQQRKIKKPLKRLKREISFYLFFARNNFQTSPKKSLLALELEKKFKEYENIQVETVFFTDGKNNNLMDLRKKYSIVMADESFADVDSLSTKSQKEIKDFFASKDIVWLALTSDLGIFVESISFKLQVVQSI